MQSTNFFTYLEDITNNTGKPGAGLDDVLKNIAAKLCKCLKIERVNIWLLIEPEGERYIHCIGNYMTEDNRFTKGERLHEKDIPSYFNHLISDKVLSIDDVYTDEITEEIREIYCKPLGIFSMMDVPLRIDGVTVGVLCFEETAAPRIWTQEEQQFCLAVAQVVALAIESHRRRDSETELRKLLSENKILMSEMHHRIKNNLSMLISLLRLQCEDAQLDETRNILRDSQNRISSIMRLHEQLYKAGNYVGVNLSAYLQDIISEFGHSKPSDVIITSVIAPDDRNIEISRAVIIGLFISEAISNCYKHAFAKRGGNIEIGMRNKNNQYLIYIKDDGVGFADMLNVQANSTLGISLMRDMAEQIDATFELLHLSPGTEVQLAFST